MEKRRTTLLALMAAIITLTWLWQAHRPVTVQESSMAQVTAEAAQGGYRLINTAELAKLYQQPSDKPLLVDTRQDWEYRSGHINGAVNLPIDPTWWGRRRSQNRLAALLGPDKDRLVVFY